MNEAEKSERTYERAVSAFLGHLQEKSTWERDELLELWKQSWAETIDYETRLGLRYLVNTEEEQIKRESFPDRVEEPTTEIPDYLEEAFKEEHRR